MNIYTYNNSVNYSDIIGLLAAVTCNRCGTSGVMVCNLVEDGIGINVVFTNFGTNKHSETKGDPYGYKGPLPPGQYDLVNDYSPGFKRILPSPTNMGVNRPGEVTTPKNTLRSGVRVHAGCTSEGCLTTGNGAEGLAVENLIRNLVGRNQNSGGTILIIKEVNCCQI